MATRKSEARLTIAPVASTAAVARRSKSSSSCIAEPPGIMPRRELAAVGRRDAHPWRDALYLIDRLAEIGGAPRGQQPGRRHRGAAAIAERAAEQGGRIAGQL